MDFTSPWHLTVIRTRGLSFVRPEKSWRPIVSVSVVDNRHDHASLLDEIKLGSDGQNPNLKSTIPIHDVNPSTKLAIQVFHKPQRKRKPKKSSLVGSASVSLADFLARNPLPHPRPVEYDVRLACPPPQRKSRTIGGKQQHSATLTVRFKVPNSPSSQQERERESPPVSPVSEHYETEPLLSDAPSSSRALSETLVTNTPDERTEEMPWGKQPERDRLDGTAGLRRRRRKKLRGFRVDSDSDGQAESSSSGEESCYPETPEDERFPSIYEDDRGFKSGIEVDEDEVVVFSPSVLPVHAERMRASAVSVRSFGESCLYWISPYEEMREAAEGDDCEKAEKVLARLLTEWYVVGASLLALAGINAAVFGFAPGGLFALQGFSLGAISIGAIASGIGLVYDAWFLLLYSGANGTKFLRIAKDVYGSYCFFALTCRLPILCMALSTVSLMAFLLAVAWTAWPTAVLVMSFVAGFLLTSQFVVFGLHRLVNLVVWAVRVVWRTLAGRRRSGAPPRAELQAQEQSRPQGTGMDETVREIIRMEMPIPCPIPAPAPAPEPEHLVVSPEHLTAPPKMEMVWAEDEDCARERETAVVAS